MAYEGNTVAIADPKLAARGASLVESGKKKEELPEIEQLELEEVSTLMDARKRYAEDRKPKEREWTESFKMYMSWVDKVLNPFLSDLFIPKTHEAVELLAAFLIGSNQSVSASAENGKSDAQKALISGKYLDFLWRKVLKARIKIQIWIKQGIVFGNGYLKVGYDPDSKVPWLAVCSIEDIYVDFFEPETQDSEYIFHEVRRLKSVVMADEKYDLEIGEGDDKKKVRELVIEGGVKSGFDADALFSTFDGSLKRPECENKVLVVEAWCKETNELKTLLPTSQGWRVARRVKNPNQYADGTPFRPFVKLRFKTSPVPNRAYDTGAVYPTVKIQKAFNDLIREYFDAVVQVGAPVWIKRRGARINPAELVRKAGQIITVGDINKDIKREASGTVDSSILQMLNRLDNEFQQASMVVNLLKGIGESDTATEAAIGQENVQTLLSMIEENVSDALSELGQMILAITLQNAEGMQSLKLYENDSEVGILEFDPKNIDGMHDVRIVPDRSSSMSKAVIQRELLNFLKIVGADQATIQRFPRLPEKVYRRWLEQAGIGDVDEFFEAEQTMTPATGELDETGKPVMRSPGMNEGKTTADLIRAASAPVVQ